MVIWPCVCDDYHDRSVSHEPSFAVVICILHHLLFFLL